MFKSDEKLARNECFDQYRNSNTWDFRRLLTIVLHQQLKFNLFVE